MEISLKTLSSLIDPIIAFLFPYILFGVDIISFLDEINKNPLTIEQKSRILMAVMFSIHYFLKTIRRYESKEIIDDLKKENEEIKKKLLEIEKQLSK